MSEPAREEARHEIASLRRFARLSLDEPIPDETTILNIRHRLEANELADDILKAGNADLARRGLSALLPGSCPRCVNASRC